MRPLRREMQMVFQDPYASLNPRKRVGSIIGDPMKIHRTGEQAASAGKRVQELLEIVGLSPEHYNRFPHEFSGGQRQRIGVARALALRPKLIVADEPVSALDVSIQAQMINLLEELQNDFNLTYLFIAHDLGVVRHVSDRIAVMYLGKLVELSPAEELYTRPIMPYTEALLSAVPIPDPDLSEQRQRIVLEGDVPSPISPPSGCRFHPRCRYATEICSQVEPPLADYGNGHLAACHHPLNVDEETLQRVAGGAGDASRGGRDGSARGHERRVHARCRRGESLDRGRTLKRRVYRADRRDVDAAQRKADPHPVHGSHPPVRQGGRDAAPARKRRCGGDPVHGPLQQLEQEPTMREIEVLQLISDGLVNREIGERLFLSEETVKSHVRHLLAKLQARSRAHAVAVGLRRGLIA